LYSVNAGEAFHQISDKFFDLRSEMYEDRVMAKSVSEI